MATITIQTDDPATVQDVENYLSSLYQRGVNVEHVTEGPDIDQESMPEKIGTGKGSDFPTKSDESESHTLAKEKK